MSLLELEELTKHFGGVKAVQGVDLVVDDGEIVSVIGPNGAGKTTLFNVVTGFYEPTDGKVTFDGQNITGRSSRSGCSRTCPSWRT
jgi:branched-chain amino acid transport system ATP-binding protein